MYCSKCGKQNSGNTDFCTNCGAPLTGPQNTNVRNSANQTPINSVQNNNQPGQSLNNQVGATNNTMAPNQMPTNNIQNTSSQPGPTPNNQFGAPNNAGMPNQTPMTNTGVSENTTILSGVGQSQSYNNQNNTQYQNANQYQNFNGQTPNQTVNTGTGATRKALKKDAKSKPKGALIGTYFAIMAIAVVLIIAVNFTMVAPAIAASSGNGSTAGVVAGAGIFVILLFAYIIVAYIASFGMQMATIKITRGETQTVGNILTQGFKNFGGCAKAFAGAIAFGLVTSLLNIVPILGFIASIVLIVYFTPTLALYILIHADEKQGNVSISDAFKKAVEMSKGHRVEFYGLVLSFFGWFVLGIVTFGIAYIWVMPYLMLSMANFYRRLIGEVTFEETEQGMSNGAVIGAVIAGDFVFIIGIIVLAASIFMVTGIGEKIEDKVNNDYDYSDTNDDWDWDYSDTTTDKTSSKLTNMSGVNVYIPSDYVSNSSLGYDSGYMSPNGTAFVGVKTLDLPSVDLSTYTKTYKDTLGNMNYTCGNIDVDNINGNEWQSFDCDYSGADFNAYLAKKSSTIYLLVISDQTDDDELVDNIEENLSFAN